MMRELATLFPSPDIGDLQIVQPALLLPHREQVGEHLKGVRLVRDAVDDGDRAVLCKFLDLRFGEGAQNERGDAVPAQHDGGVLDALPARKLRLVLGQEEVIAAELADAHLEGDARARRGVPEQQRDRLPAQDGLVLAHGGTAFSAPSRCRGSRRSPPW